MRIGIANPFAHRPHVGHMVFIYRQFGRLGYQTFFLGCGGALDNCNSKVNKVGISRRLECVKCRVGGIKSYLNIQPSRIDLKIPVSSDAIKLGKELSYSTACTALRIEHKAEADSLDFRAIQDSLGEPTARVYLNTRNWIRDNGLESVFVFNGRFDVTRAILEACLAESVRFVSVERSWFGDGLQLLPGENCLGLRNYHDSCSRWARRPVKYDQAIRASQLIIRRLKRISFGEWRQYNIDKGARYKRDHIKYLFLPSSQHEWLGHSDRTSEWHHPVEGVEYLFTRLGLKMSELVVRGHPGWARKIQSSSGDQANEFYKDWTKRVGAEYIEPIEKIDTHELIKISNMILVNGSSASMEASWRGKPIVSFVPAAFTSSGISVNLFSRSDVDSLGECDVQSLIDPGTYFIDPVVQCQLALRYIYCANFRIMQFVDSVKGAGPYAFNAGEPSDLSGLESLALRGVLQEDDNTFDCSDTDERQVAEAILSGNIDFISTELDSGLGTDCAPIKRRKGYRLIDLVFN